MRYILGSLGLLLVLVAGAQSASPEPVYSLARALYDLEYYETQAQLWQAETEKDPSNTQAWQYFYAAARNYNALHGSSPYDLPTIVAELQRAIPNSFEAAYITYWHSHLFNKDYDALLRAYQREPDRTEIIHDMVHYYAIKGNLEEYRSWCTKLYETNLYGTGLLEWNYNALASVRTDGVLLTQGDNDTYPAWVLQEGRGIRQDVMVVNLYLLLAEAEYRSRVFTELDIPDNFNRPFTAALNIQVEQLLEYVLRHCRRPVHLGISTPGSQRQAFSSNLFLTGLVFEYSLQFIDNLRLIRHNYEQKFRMDHLRTPLSYDPSESVVNHMNMNYVPALSLLHDLYLDEGNEQKADQITGLALEIAQRAGKSEQVEDLFNIREELTTPGSSTNIDLRSIDKSLRQVGPDKYISAFEVSNALYQSFLQDLLDNKRFDLIKICQTYPVDWVALLPEEYRDLSPTKLFQTGHPEGEEAPVVNISYEAAILFCEWLTEVYNASDHRKKKFKAVRFRLPAEQEWMEAARFGYNFEGTPYPWGGPYYRNSKGCLLANFNPYLISQSDSVALFSPSGNPESPGEDGAFFPVSVSSYHPNRADLYNMSGNVAEMIQEEGVTKGGGWQDPAYYMQISSRNTVELPSPNVGFRIYVDVIQEF